MVSMPSLIGRSPSLCDFLPQVDGQDAAARCSVVGKSFAEASIISVFFGWEGRQMQAPVK